MLKRLCDGRKYKFMTVMRIYRYLPAAVHVQCRRLAGGGTQSDVLPTSLGLSNVLSTWLAKPSIPPLRDWPSSNLTLDSGRHDWSTTLEFGPPLLPQVELARLHLIKKCLRFRRCINSHGPRRHIQDVWFESTSPNFSLNLLNKCMSSLNC